MEGAVVGGASPPLLPVESSALFICPGQCCDLTGCLALHSPDIQRLCLLTFLIQSLVNCQTGGTRDSMGNPHGLLIVAGPDSLRLGGGRQGSQFVNIRKQLAEVLQGTRVFGSRVWGKVARLKGETQTDREGGWHFLGL